jgi:hypothetical protein
MRISRLTVLPAIAALSVAGTILAAPAMAATTQASGVYVYVHQSAIGGPGVYVHQ